MCRSVPRLPVTTFQVPFVPVHAPAPMHRRARQVHRGTAPMGRARHVRIRVVLSGQNRAGMAGDIEQIACSKTRRGMHVAVGPDRRARLL